MFRLLVTLALATLGLASCVRIAGEPETFSCANDSECAEGEECSKGMCQITGHCDSDDDCADSEACSNSRCEDVACKHDNQCEVSQVCRDYACIDVECTDRNAEVCGAYACVGDKCLAACNGSSDCSDNGGLGVECINSTCVLLECAEGTPCPGSFACLSGQCATSCTSDALCDPNSYCKDSACVPRRAPGALGDPCTSDNECMSASCCPAFGCTEIDGCDNVGCGGEIVPCYDLPLSECESRTDCSWWEGEGCDSDNYLECYEVSDEDCTSYPGCQLQEY